MKLALQLGLGTSQRAGDPAGPVLDTAGSLDVTTYKIGTAHTITAGTATASGGGSVTYEYLWAVGGSTAASTAAYTPDAGDDGLSITAAWRAVETGGTNPGATGWQSVGSGTVTYPAPTITATDALVGRTLTITVDAIAAGATASLTTLTLDGSPVSATGSGPWEYVVASAYSAQTVAWEVTATSTGGTATSSGSEVVAADLSVPVAAGGLADLTLTLDAAMTPVNVAADFTGTAPITYALAPSSGALPTGLSLSSAGSLTGTPTVEVTNRSIVVRGTNSGGTDDTAFSITVAEADVTAPTASSVTPGTQDAEGNMEFTVTSLSENSTFGIVWTSTDQSAATPAAIKTAAEGGTSLTDQLSIDTQAITLGTSSYTITDGLPSGRAGTTYYQSVFWDASGNLSAAFNGSVTLDTTAPTISTLSPADNATDVAIDANLVMTFSEAMKQQGTVELRNVGGAPIQTFDLSTDGTWSIGDTVWTGDPTADFANSANLCVRWSGLEDTKANALADNTGDTTWNFDVAAAASGVTITYIDGGIQEADGSTATVAGLTLGALAADECYAICVNGRGFAGVTPSSLTLDGQSTTLAVSTADTSYSAIFYTALGATIGATGDAVVTVTTAITRSTHIAVYKVSGAAAAAPADTATYTGNSSTATLLVDAPADSGVIATTSKSDLTIGSTSSSMGTSDYDVAAALIAAVGFSHEEATGNATFDPNITLAGAGANGRAVAAVWT